MGRIWQLHFGFSNWLLLPKPIAYVESVMALEFRDSSCTSRSCIVMIDLRLTVSRALALCSILSILLSSAVFAENDGEKQIMRKFGKDEFPVTVLQAFHKKHPKSKVIGADKEVEDSVAFYKIKIIDKNVERSFVYSADGKLFESGEVIPLSSVPSKVTTSLFKIYQRESVEKSEKVHRGKKTEYEFEVSTEKERLEIRVDAEGKILKTKTLPDEPEEDDD